MALAPGPCLWSPGRGAGGSYGYACVLRLVPLYQLLQPMAGCARVAQCAEAVPTLLQAFFSAVTQVSSPSGAPHSHGPHNRGAGQSQHRGVLLSSAEGSSHHTCHPQPL